MKSLEEKTTRRLKLSLSLLRKTLLVYLSLFCHATFPVLSRKRHVTIHQTIGLESCDSELESTQVRYFTTWTRTWGKKRLDLTLTWKTMPPDSTRLETSWLGKLESSVRTQQAAASAEHATDHWLIDWDSLASLPLCSLAWPLSQYSSYAKISTRKNECVHVCGNSVVQTITHHFRQCCLM